MMDLQDWLKKTNEYKKQRYTHILNKDALKVKLCSILSEVGRQEEGVFPP